MASGEPQPQAPKSGGESGLGPGHCGERARTPGRPGLQHQRRRDPGCIGDAAEGGATAQKEEGRLRVRKACELSKERAGLFNTLFDGVCLAEGRRAYGCSEQRERTRRVRLNPGREEPHVNTVVSPGTSNDLTLLWVELEPNVPGSGREAGQARSDMAVVACKANVIKECKDKVRWCKAPGWCHFGPVRTIWDGCR